MQHDSNPNKGDLILACVQHYRFEHIKGFLVSLRESGYRGDTVFFCQDIEPSTLSEMEKFGVKIIPFDNYRFRMGPRIIRGIMNKFCWLYYRLKWPFFDKYWHTLLSGVKQRFYLYYQYLLKNKDKYNRVLLVDVRDIYFQRNPFQDYPGKDLIFFEEDHRHFLKVEPHNPLWMKTVLGKATLDRLGDKVTICSGTTMGSPTALIWYLEVFLKVMKESDNLQSVAGEDQAIHNATVYEHLTDCPFTVFISPNNHGPVYTVGGPLPLEEIKLSPDKEILFPDGRVAPIIHQYDRHPSLVECLSAKVEAV